MSELTLEFNVATRAVQFAVPVELARKNIKSIQKQVEKTKKQCLDEAARVQAHPHMSAADKLVHVKKLVKVAENSHRRLQKAVQADADFRARLRSRLVRLQQLQPFVSTSDGGEVLDLHNDKLMAWFVQETNLLVVDYLVKCSGQRGYNAGMALLRSLGPAAQSLVDHDIYSLFNDIFLAISDDHNLGPVSAWYNDNKALLRKINSNLLFEIHYCKYLFLIEQGDMYDAVRYSTENLAPYACPEHYASGRDDPNYARNSACLAQMGSGLISLAVSAEAPSVGPWARLAAAPDPEANPFMRYHRAKSSHSWRLLYQTFSRDFASVYGISHNFPLFIYLSAGLSSLKTKSCYCNEQNTLFGPKSPSVSMHADFDKSLDSSRLRNLALRGPNQYYRLLSKINQCPVCSPELYALSRSLPDAQLITHIFDNPFKLPNGNIYAFDKVLDSEKDSDLVRHGKIRDPLTHEIFLIDDCVRVYPA